MSKNISYTVYSLPPKRSYGFFHLLFDIVMTILTCGFWLIIILIKYLRTNSR